MVNSLDGTNIIPGWQGPYLDKEMTHYLSKGTYQDLFLAANNDVNWACDLDGDGNTDGQFIVYRSEGVSERLAVRLAVTSDRARPPNGDIEYWHHQRGLGTC